MTPVPTSAIRCCLTGRATSSVITVLLRRRLTMRRLEPRGSPSASSSTSSSGGCASMGRPDDDRPTSVGRRASMLRSWVRVGSADGHRIPHPAIIRRSTICRMPPWRRYSTLDRGVDAGQGLEGAGRSVVGRRLHRHATGAAAMSATPRIANVSLARQAERLGRLAVQELQRQHAHAHEVRAVDALVRLRDHRPHAEQHACPSPPSRATSRSRTPCRRAPRAGCPRRGSARRRRRSTSARRSASAPSTPPSTPGTSAVAQADVGERAAHHHLVVAAARAVRVEVAPLDAVLEQVLPGRAGRAGWSRRARCGRS